METAKEIVDSTAKAAMEKLKEMNMVETAKEIVSKTTPFVSNLFDWLLKTSKEIVVKTTPSVRTSSNWLLEKAPSLISTATNQIQKAPLYYTIPIGFLLIWLLSRCCGGGGGTGKTMKAPGRKNVRMARRDFESSPKSYFRNLRSKKK